jgi:hypothetical protein
MKNMYLELFDGRAQAIRKVLEHIEFEISNLIMKCRFYDYDGEAFEEYCQCPSLKEKFKRSDFSSRKDCIHCEFYTEIVDK